MSGERLDIASCNWPDPMRLVESNFASGIGGNEHIGGHE